MFGSGLHPTPPHFNTEHKTMTIEQYTSILDEHPDLTTDGFMPGKSQDDLRTKYDEFLRAYDYLWNIGPKHWRCLFQKYMTSELHARYIERMLEAPVSHGAFIAAAIAFGLGYKRTDGETRVQLVR